MTSRDFPLESTGSNGKLICELSLGILFFFLAESTCGVNPESTHGFWDNGGNIPNKKAMRRG